MAEYDHHQKDLREQIVSLIFYNNVSREEAWALSATERKEMFEFTQKRLKAGQGTDGSEFSAL